MHKHDISGHLNLNKWKQIFKACHAAGEEECFNLHKKTAFFYRLKYEPPEIKFKSFNELSNGQYDELH